MNRRIWVTLVSLAVAQFSWGQTNAVSTPVIAENAALDPGTLAVIGATAEQETALRSQIQLMHLDVFPCEFFSWRIGSTWKPPGHFSFMRSEERRVGKECRSWWSSDH